MKKLFILLSVLVTSVIAFSQGAPYPNYQPQGSPTTRWSQQGAVQGMKGVINGVYTDTSAANIGYIDYYPGAQIFTTLDSSFWLRNPRANRWMKSNAGAGSVLSFTYNTDSSIVICYGDGTCDTIPIYSFTEIINNVVNNLIDSSSDNVTFINDSTIIICDVFGACDTIDLGNTNNYYFLNDSTLVTCDTPQVIQVGDDFTTQQLCDTITVPRQSLYIFQNGIAQYPPRIIEHGWVNDGDSPGMLNHDTYLFNKYYKYSITGVPYLREVFNVQQKRVTWEGNTIQSWNHLGMTGANDVNLYLGYTDTIMNNSVGYVGDRIGYLTVGNAVGSRYSMAYNNVSAKQSGILYHTADTANTDGVSIFSTQTPLTMPFWSNPSQTTWYDKRIAVFKTTGQQQNPKYGDGLFPGDPTYSLLVDEDGNIIEGAVAGGGDVITIINDTTINICSFGTNLCDTIIINNVGTIQTVTILNDSTLLVCGTTPPCDTLHIPQTTFSQPITADNGLTMNTPTNVQLFGPISGPATLLNDRYLTSSTSTWRLNITGVTSAVDGAMFNVTTTGSGGTAIKGTSSNGGRGLYGIANGTGGVGVYGQDNGGDVTGLGVFASSTEGVGLWARSYNYIAGQFTIQPAATSTVATILEIVRSAAGASPGVNGIGGSIDFRTRTNGAVENLSHSIVSLWTDVNNPTRSSQYILRNVNNAVTSDVHTVHATGQHKLNKYGIGTFFDTTANYLLGVQSDGDVIEIPASALGGSSITIINDTTFTICSNGDFLCDTFITITANPIQYVTIINDSTLLVCDTLGVCETFNVGTGSGGGGGFDRGFFDPNQISNAETYHNTQGYSFSVGRNLTISPTGVSDIFNFGNGNIILPNTVEAFVANHNNTVGGSENVVMGRNMVVRGNSNFSAGTDGTISSTSNYSASFGDANDLFCIACFTSGFGNDIYSENGVVFGSDNVLGSLTPGTGTASQYDNEWMLGTQNRSTGHETGTLGYYIQNTGRRSIAIGSGFGSTRLVNNLVNVIAFGTNSDSVTMYIHPAAGTTGTIGKVSIGTAAPTATRFEVVDNTVGGGSMARFSSTSTAATGDNLNRVVEIIKSGTQVNAVNSSALYISQTTVPGFGAVAYGIYSAANIASGSGNSWAIRADVSTQGGMWATATTGTAVLAQSSSAAYTIGSFNTSSGPAIQGQNTSGTGYGVHGISTSNIGVYGQANSTYGVQGTSVSAAGGNFARWPTSSAGDAAVLNVLRLERINVSNTVGNGVGGSIEYYLEASDASVNLSNQIISKSTDVTVGTRTSQLDITGVNSGTTQTIMSAYGTGVVGIGISSAYTATRLEVVDNAVGDGSMVALSSTSTTSSANTQKLLSVALSGANANTFQTTYAGYFTNMHTGTAAFNRAIYGETTGSSSVAGYFLSTNGIGLYGASSGGSYGVEGAATVGNGVYGHSDAGGVGVQGFSVGGVGMSANSSRTGTTDVGTVLEVVRGTSGTAANGLGGSIDFQIEANDGTNYLSNQIISKWVIAANASRESQAIITGVQNTATVNLLTLNADGSIQLRPITATAASAITPAEGMIVMVSDTNGTFTSVGFWGYSGGAWAKF